MSNTRIRARITDQHVELILVPLIASGSVGVLQIQCVFDDLWDGYGKTAVFYKTEDEVFHVAVASDLVTVPQEVLADEGEFFFGIMGVADNTRTTETVRLQVKQGALTKSTATPAAPTPDIYKQLLANYGRMEARFNQIVAMKGTGNATTHTLSDEYVSGTIKTNGAVGYIEFTISKMSLVAGGNHYTDYCIPPEIAALCPVSLESTNSNIDVTLQAAATNGWSRILIENVGSSAYTTDMVTTVRGIYPLSTMFVAELADMRVDADGKSYSTAGGAVRDHMTKRPGFKGLPDPESFNRLTANLGQGFYVVTREDWDDLPGGASNTGFALLVFWYTTNYNLQIAYCTKEGLVAYRIVNANTGEIYKDWWEQNALIKYIEQDLNDEQKAQVRENIGAASIDPSDDHANTRVTLTVTAGQLLDLRGIYRQENRGGVTRIDWGDGNKNNVVGTTDDEMRHTYAEAGTYTITMTGLTHLPASIFREKNVSAVEIGTTVQFMGYLAFTANPSLAEIRIYAEVPPEISLSGGGYGPFEFAHLTKETIIVPEYSLPAYMQAGNWVLYKDVLTTDETKSTVLQDKVVTVGAGGDFATINDALAYLSRYYPAYKANGIKCEIQILAGTIITEQIFVERADLSYITITSAASDNKVQVAPSNAWGGIAHDTRGNKPFISGENGARLPCIKCLFSCIVPEGGWVTTGVTEAINCAVGYFCNRGSTGVIAGHANSAGVLDNIGFENFYDNIIANNNSEIVLREAYARGAARYGVMSRHISRVSARSANITNSGDTAAYADRASMLDVRHADLTGSKNGIAAYHASTVTANETVASSIPGTVADAQYGSTINCQAITAAGSKDAFKVTGGATIVATGAKVTNATGTKYSQATNTLTENGVIYA